MLLATYKHVRKTGFSINILETTSLNIEIGYIVLRFHHDKKVTINKIFNFIAMQA